MPSVKFFATVAVSALAILSSAAAQQPRVYTDADYKQAEKFMPYNTNSLVMHTVANPTWMPDGRMWYRDTGPTGVSFILIDPMKKSKGRAFDQVKLAAALKPFARGDVIVDANHLAIPSFTLSDADKTVNLTFSGQQLACDLSADGVCKPSASPSGQAARGGGRRGGGGAAGGRGGVAMSPDGSKGAFIRDWNLWVRDTASGQEMQLTTDGIKDYGYATDNAGWSHSDNAILVWSPDSKRIATFQQDQRKTGELYLVNTTYLHPRSPSSRTRFPAIKM